jgi:hypothetical protein
MTNLKTILNEWYENLPSYDKNRLTADYHQLLNKINNPTDLINDAQSLKSNFEGGIHWHKNSALDNLIQMINESI